MPNINLPLHLSVSLLVILLLLTACRPSAGDETEAGDMRVADGFAAEMVAGPDLVSYPMFATMDEQGRLYVFESTGPNTMSTEEMLENPTYRISILEDVTGDGVFDKSHVFADRLPLPQGGVFYQGSLYVTASPDLLRLTDTTGNGVADEREVILTGWTLSANACTLQGPYFGPDGWLYMPDCRRGYSIETKEGELLEGNGARIWRSRTDGSGLEWVSAGGFDNAIGLAFMPAGELIGTMTYFTDPQHGQRDALMHWVEGGVYPKPHSVNEEDRLIRTGELMPVMSKLPRVAPSGIHRYRGAAFGPEYTDNLFSVHFNTGRLIRSIPSRDGATFRTEDEEFFTSGAPRFHLTDVLEDADGSLLVLDTGGWFVQGCPLTGDAQGEARGGIYRIQKTDAPAVEDPRGEELDLENQSPELWVQHLSDPRPVVRDRATELLVQAGGAAVGPLAAALEGNPSPAGVRLAAVFALYRIGTPQARKAVRSALTDGDLQVRIAAARSAGMARDRQAVDRLTEMVAGDQAPARRQAATALGQIGDARATEALLAAASNPDDRFVEHALIYSIITIGNAPPVVRALGHDSVSVRKAALISLDQMEGDHLTSGQLAGFLRSEVQELRSTALWIASRHPEWTGEVLNLLASLFEREELTGQQAASASQVLIAFCSDEQVQELLARLLARAGNTTRRNLLLMDTVERCEADLSLALVNRIGEQLETADEELRLRAVDLIRSRGLAELMPRLEDIAGNKGEPDLLRMAAMDALVRHRPQLPEVHYSFLLDKLEPGHPASLRQSSARTLGQSELDEEQLLRLATDYFPRMEPFIATRLKDAFVRSGQSSAVGRALIASLLESPELLDSFTEREVRELFAGYPGEVQESAYRLAEQLRQRNETRLQRLEELESQLAGGDVRRGRELFFGDKALCSTCHAIGGEGSNFGPDLTNIGEIRSTHDILETILYPNVNFAREYETYRIETTETVYTGIIKEETPRTLVVDVSPETRVRIPRDEILALEQAPNSMMPPGLESRMSTAELTDLMAFLEALPYRLDRLIDSQ